MPPRRYRRLTQIVVLETPKPAPKEPGPPTITDEQGRAWEVAYLISHGKGNPAGTTPNAHDATHRGFRWSNLRRVYEFQSGDDRSLNERTIATQFACAKKTRNQIEALHANARPATPERYADKVQAMYQRRRDEDARRR